MMIMMAACIHIDLQAGAGGGGGGSPETCCDSLLAIVKNIHMGGHVGSRSGKLVGRSVLTLMSQVSAGHDIDSVPK